MSRGFFVAGTDTGVGKTCVSLGLMRALQSRGFTVAGMKPVASGCEVTRVGLSNEDARQLLAQSALDVAYQQVNPFAFERAIAPHLAAEASGASIQIPVIQESFQQLTAQADYIVVEGVGGWCVPLNRRQTMADVAIILNLPVILVVGIRLGCLNHALLTAAAIADSGLKFAGWVANRIDPGCEDQDGNVKALVERLPAPLLADIDYTDNKALPAELLAGELRLDALLASDASS